MDHFTNLQTAYDSIRTSDRPASFAAQDYTYLLTSDNIRQEILVDCSKSNNKLQSCQHIPDMKFMSFRTKRSAELRRCNESRFKFRCPLSTHCLTRKVTKFVLKSSNVRRCWLFRRPFIIPYHEVI